MKTLHFWIKSLLPRIGSCLKKLDLSNCKSLNNNLARRILQLCLNIEDLNLSYTNIGQNTFRGVRLDKLKTLNCEGCDKLSDNAFKFLLLTSILDKNVHLKHKSQHCLRNVTIKCKILPNDVLLQHEIDQAEVEEEEEKKNENEKRVLKKSVRRVIDCNNCTLTSNIEDLIEKDKNNHNLVEENTQNSLESINLSGCCSLTDYGLSYIASKYDLSTLKYLNLSGCVNLTGFGMNLFVELSPDLSGENLYYCDNIQDGPLREEANGCENVECGSKYCCRNARN